MAWSKQPKKSANHTTELEEYKVEPSSEAHQLQLPDSSEVHLSDLVENYAHCVPFRFQVVNGFKAENVKDPTLGVDEVYSAHLVKEIKVVVVNHDGVEFEIPVNSAAKFGLIPHLQSSVSLYETVEDMLSAKQLPKVVTVKKKYVHPENKFSLRSHEILIVKDAVKGRIGRSKTALRVFSMSSYRELALPKDCDAQFTTEPYSTQLYLTDLLDNVVNLLPCSARIYPSEGSSLAQSLTSSIIEIERQEVHRSVIVSLFRDNPTSKCKKDTKFIDLPTTIDIRVKTVKTDKSDEAYQRIHEESQDLLTDFNPSKLQACVDAPTDDHYMTQAQLLAEIRKEMEIVPQQYQELLVNEREAETNYEAVHETKIMHKPSSANSPSIQPRLNSPVLPPRDTELKQSKPPLPPPVAKRKKDSNYSSSTAANQFKKAHPLAKLNTGSMEDSTHLQKTVKGNPLSAVKSSEAKKKKLPPIPRKKLASQIYEELPDISTSADVEFVDSRLPASKAAACYSKPKKMVNHSYEEMDSLTLPMWASGRGHADIVRNRISDGDSHPQTSNVPLQDPYVKLTKTTVPTQDVLHSNLESAGMLLVSGQLNEIQNKLADIVNQMGAIQMRQSVFEADLSALKAAELPVGGVEKTPFVTTSMSPAEVLNVLSAAGLSQYCENFIKEAVDGEMFMVLDEEILTDELGIKSKLHRIRILRMKEIVE